MKTIDLEIKTTDYQTEFIRIAGELMNGWFLIAGSSRYQIAEVEFYLKSAVHQDDYSHGHEIQKENSKWYFHPSGVDITFGNGINYGGILIRAIINFDTKKYTYGPLNCLTEIFFNFSTIYTSSIPFGLSFDEHSEIVYEEPISARRVGLTKDKNPDMYEKQYRFLIMINEKHAQKEEIIKLIPKDYKQ